MGKTTFALQTAAMLLPGAERPQPDPVHGHSYGWGQFPLGARLAPDETIWYVECFRPLWDVVEKFQSIGVPLASSVSGGVHACTLHEVANARTESVKEGPVSFDEMFRYVKIKNGGKIPTVLIVDGIFGLLASGDNKDISRWEMGWFRSATGDYLSQGGTLIGVQTHTASKRAPDTVNANSTPGSFALSGSAKSVTEVIYDGKRNDNRTSRKRRVNISGPKFPSRSLSLEFIEPGILIPSLGNDSPEVVRGVPPPVSGEKARAIMDFAVLLSAQNGGRFPRQELVRECAGLNISDSTITRWLKDSRISGTVRHSNVTGWYMLMPAPKVQ